MGCDLLGDALILGLSGVKPETRSPLFQITRCIPSSPLSSAANTLPKYTEVPRENVCPVCFSSVDPKCF